MEASIASAASDGEWLDLSVNPLRRELGEMAYDGSKTILFGGCCIDARTPLPDTWAWRNGGWSKLHPAHTPPGRSYPLMALDETRDEVVLFGGLGRSAGDILGDTWTWDGNDWTHEPTAISPPPRYSASMAFDPVSGQIVLFGGCDAGGCDLADTWTWTGDGWIELTPAHSPTGRSSAAMVSDRSHDQILLFGGFSGGRGLADTWLWKDGDWVEAAVQPSPPARLLAGVAYDESSESVVLYGGFSSGPEFAMRSDTWTWNGASWSQAAPATSPGARMPMMTHDGASGDVVLFGGLNAGGWWDTDTWTWDGVDWTRLAIVDPSERMDAAAAYDSERRELVMFSGFCSPNNSNTSPQVANQSPRCGSATFGDTWTWDGARWTQEETTIAPLNRQHAVMEFHEGSGLVVLVGGSCGSIGCNDAWTWDGAGWSPMIAPPQVTGRSSGASIVYDAARDQLVLFGGSASATSTWTWDGESWTEHPQTGGPEARSLAAMAYDQARGEVVLFGGFDHSPSDFLRPSYADMWTWDGSRWTRETPGVMPPKRYLATMEYDVSTRQMILHGGIDRVSDPAGNTVFSDTWAWDGEAWRQLAPAGTAYPAMSAMAAAFPPLDGVVVMGGLPQNPSKILNSVRLWTGGDISVSASQIAFTERSAVTAQFSDEAIFEAVLRDANGTPIAGQQVTFTLAGAEGSRSLHAITDGQGVAPAITTISEAPGSINLTVDFAGDRSYGPSAAATEFIVAREDTTTILEVEGKSNETLRARLVDLDSSEGIASRTIDFYVGSERVGSAATDADGWATIEVPPRYRGKRDFKARFEGDSFYLPSRS